jgi:hypothetical protein
MLQERTPNQIRDESIKCFNQMAPAKYDAGQSEHGGLLDEREDIIADLRGEAIDFWFYVETAARQLEEKDERIEELEKQVKHYKEIAAR